MKGENFKKACLVFIVSILSQWAAYAQIPYFVYLQSDNNQVFSVQVNQKKYASSTVGHCIVPGLISGSYKIEVTFNGSDTPQDYGVDIKDNDQGYLIKAMNGGTDFALLNMKTGALQYSGTEKQKALDAAKAKKQAEEDKARAGENARLEQEARIAAAAKQEAEEKEALERKEKEDALRNIQQEATALQQKDSLTIKEAPEKPKEVIQAAKETMQVVNEEEAAQKALKEKQEAEVRKYNEERRLALEKEKAENVATTSEETSSKNTTSSQGTLSRAEIVRLQEEARKIDAQGKRDSLLKAKEQAPANKEKSAFLDMDFTMPVPAKDTLTPEMPPVKKEELKKPKLNTESESTVIEKKAEEKMDSSNMIKVEPLPATPSVSTNPDTPKKEEMLPQKPTEPSKNAACNATASKEEIDLITMMIKAEKNVEEAIDLIRKITRLKCVSTQQVRTMASAFSGEEERYRILDLCYRYTLDKDAYPALANLLSDIYYINRFKALLR